MGLIFILFALGSIGEITVHRDKASGHPHSSLVGIPFLQNYTSDAVGPYGQFWAIAQMPSGKMVFGTAGGISMFVGHARYDLRIPGNVVHSIGIGNDGRLYVGGINEFGYIATDSIGRLEFVSLKPVLSEEFTNFTRVWKTIAVDEEVYFQSPEYIFRWGGDSMAVYTSETQFTFLASVNGRIIVRILDRGLYQLVDGEFQILPHSELFADKIVRMILPYDDAHLLIGTANAGFYLYDGQEFSVFATEANAYLTENLLYQGTRLPDGSFSLSTLHGGVVIMERDGRIRYIIDRRAGLQDQSVLVTYADQTGALWIGTQNGLSRLEPMMPLTRFDERTGIAEMVTCFAEYDGTIYAGTLNGIFRLEQHPKQVGYGIFSRVGDLVTNVWSLSVIGNDLIAATTRGLYRIEEEGSVELYSGVTPTILASRFNNEIVYFLTRNSVMIGTYQNQSLTILGESETIPEVVNLAEDSAGAIFVSTRVNGVYRLEWDFPSANDKSSARIRSVTNISLPSHWDEPDEVRVFYYNGRIRVAAFDGLYTITEDYGQLIPDSLFTEDFAGGGKGVYTITKNNPGEVYIKSAGDVYVARPTDTDRFIVEQGILKRITLPLATSPFALYCDSRNNLWIGSSDGIYLFNTNINFDHGRQFAARITDMYLDGDSLIYRGVLMDMPPRAVNTFKYARNNFRINFFVPAYENVGLNQYQTKLEPLDEDWSRWSSEWFKDYTNLREGRYRFLVRGMDAYGNISRPASLEFRIMPPWYRTWYAYTASVMMVLLFLFGIHKYRIGRILEIERTRTRIAQDLHDDIGSNLSSIALMIDLVSHRDSISETDRAELHAISTVAREMVDSLRDIVWLINPEHDKLENLIERMKTTAGNMLPNMDFSLQIDVISKYESVSMDFKRSVLLIYKEALNNIIKHANASSVKILIREENGLFYLRIEDNGVGFDQTVQREGSGLQNMRYRAQQIYGTLTITTEPGAGTIIELKAELM